MLLRNEQTGEEIRLWWEDDRVITQRVHGEEVGAANDRKRPSRLAARVEAVRLAHRYYAKRFVLVDAATPRAPTPADRRATPLLAQPPWLDPEAAIVETDRLLELGDPLAEFVAGTPDLIWVPEAMGALSDTRPLIELEIDHGYARAASVLIHLDEKQLTAALRRLFGIGGRRHIVSVLMAELASLEVTRYLERITLSGLDDLDLEALDAFEHLKAVSIEPSRGGAFYPARVTPRWLKGLDELRLNVDFSAQGLFESGSAVRSLMMRVPSGFGTPGPRELLATMTRDRWPNLTELALSVVAPVQAIAGLAEAGMLSELQVLDLSRCTVTADDAITIDLDLARYPDLIVRRPVITDRTQRRIAGLDAHPRQQMIDALAPSSEIAYEARRLAFENPYYNAVNSFRDSGGDELELWAYHEHGLTELRLADGHYICECPDPKPCVHVLALMYRAVEQDQAEWLS